MTYDKKYQVWKFFSPLVISDECTTHELIAEKCTQISETCLETDNLSDVTAKKKKVKDQIQKLFHVLWCISITNSRVFGTTEAGIHWWEGMRMGNNKGSQVIEEDYDFPIVWIYFPQFF